MHHQKGFSLVELIVVIAIFAVITVLVASAYFKLKPSIRVNGAARQIVGDLMLARMRAVSENNNYIITFGTSTNTYKIYDDNNNDFTSPNVDATELVKEVVISDEYKGIGYGYSPAINKTDNTTALDKSVTFAPSSGLVWFRFEPSGRANKSGGIYIIPTEDITNNRKGRGRAVTVINSTGRVKIYEYTGLEWK